MQKRLPILICFGLVATLLLALGLYGQSGRAADNPKTWFDLTKTPTIEMSTIGNLSSPQFNSSIKLGYSPTCEYKEYLTRDFVLSIPLVNQTTYRCWQNTNIGLLDKYSNTLVVNGIVAGKIANINANAYLRTTPAVGVFSEIKGNSSTINNNYVKFHFGAKVTSSRNLLGTTTHTFTPADSMTLKKSDGTHVALGSASNLNYTSNGKWAVAATENYALFRVNLETKRILNFGEPMQNLQGRNPLMAVSITNDGRYAVATPTNITLPQWLRIYDLQDCEDGEQDYVASTNARCAYRDLTGLLRSHIPGFYHITMAEFGDANTLIFYHRTSGSNPVYTKFTIRAPNAGPLVKSYVALGDSYASGEGAYDYFKGTDEGDKVNLCHLSKNSYPYLIGRELGLLSTKSIACSGAKLKNIVGVKGQENIKVPLTKKNENERTNQSVNPKDIINAELKDDTPGYKLQRQNIGDYSPDVITISMIGNDIGFGDKIKRCLMPDECYNTYEDRLEILRSVRGKFSELAHMYKDILSAGNKNARLYVIGYPLIGNPPGKCDSNVWLNQEELFFANQLIANLNDVIEAATKNAGVGYVNTESAFEGFAYCDSSVNKAMNGLLTGDDKLFGIIGNESYHPNILGHQLYRNVILEQTDWFTTPMPAPNPASGAPSQEDDLVFLNKPKTYRTVANTFYSIEMSDEVLIRNGTIDINAGDLQTFFMPNSNVQAELHSTPLVLGSLQADSAGRVAGSVLLPSFAPVGYHTLKLIGTDLYGQTLSFEKVVYVAHSLTDKNGNDIADADEPCGVFATSNLDKDADGIDDACDPEYTERLVVVPPPIAIKDPVVVPAPFAPVTVIAPSTEVVPAAAQAPIFSDNQQADVLAKNSSLPLQDFLSPDVASTTKKLRPASNNTGPLLIILGLCMVLFTAGCLLRYAKR